MPNISRRPRTKSATLPIALFLRLSRFRAFWSIHSKLNHLVFLFRRNVFNVKRQAGEGKSQTTTFIQLAFMTTRQLLASILFVSFLQFINSWTYEIYIRTGLPIQNDTYTTLLGTTAAMGGVLIGLYYAATTAIAGAIYSNVPNNVRDLLAQDRVGNIYMRFLSFTTFCSIVLLAFRAAGLQWNPLAATLSVLGTGISIIAFVKLGARAFYLFDPTTLSGELVETIQNAFRKIRPGQYRWNDPAFQAHANRTARFALDTSKTLAEITSKQSQLSGQPFVTLCTQFLHLLRLYQTDKKSIPSNSRWYPRRRIFPDWYRSDDSSTSLAFQASSRLDPKEVSDHQWIEEALLPTIYLCLRKNLESGRHDLVSSFVRHFDTYTKKLSSEHDVKAALDAISQLANASSDLLFSSKPEGTSPDPIENIALADALASMLVTVLLSYIEAINRDKRATIATAISRINWKSEAAIFNLELPRHIIPQLEWMQPRIDFELRTDGARVSPDWYLVELAIQPHLQNLKDCLTGLVDTIQSLFDQWIKETERASLPWVRANILSRESEYWSKFDYHFSTIRRHHEELNSDRRIDGLPWPTIDLGEIEERVRNRKRLLLQRMAENSTILISEKRQDEYPDFAGQFLHTVGENLISAFLANDFELAVELFPHFFLTTFMQRDRLGADITDAETVQNSSAIKVSVAPILDLMCLSGYGILLSEYHENPKLGELIAGTWNKFLDQYKKNGQNLLPFLAASLSITNTAFELAHRSLVRTHWGQRVSNLLRQLPRRSVRTPGAFISQSVAIHKSPLVRVLAVDRIMTSYSGIDIFIETVVSKRPDRASANFQSRRDLARAILREEEREQGDEDSDNDEEHSE